MILTTQSMMELVNSGLLELVNESCPLGIFLANPGIDRKLYAETFQLNDTELELLESLVPKRDLLFKQPGYAKKLRLDVDSPELLDGDQYASGQHPQTGLLCPLRAGQGLLLWSRLPNPTNNEVNR